jgi:RimJ/RimL family protein N-acetyltransferase
MSVKEPHQFSTPRTILFPLDDIKIIAQLLDHDSIRNSIFIKTYQIRLKINEWTKDEIKKLVSTWKKAPTNCGVYAIQTNLQYPLKTKKSIGVVSILPSGNDNTGILLDVLIHPDFGGLGFATECAKVVLKDIFMKSKFQRVSSILRHGNTKWNRVLEKLGFSFHNHCMFGEQNCHIYSITRQQFFERWMIPEEDV